MQILHALLNSLKGNAPVRSVLIGAHWTVVCSRGCGMAATIAADESPGKARVRDAGRLHRKSARELAEYALSTDLLEAGIGMAAINSMLEVDEAAAVEINASKILVERGRGRSVALVGRFHFIPDLRRSAAQLWVIEQHPNPDEYPAESAGQILPRADVIAITGSSLINHTLGDLLAMCRPEATVMVLGPSTPLSPVLFGFGVNILSGARVVDEAAVLRTAGQGAAFRQVEGVKLLSLVDENRGV